MQVKKSQGGGAGDPLRGKYVEVPLVKKLNPPTVPPQKIIALCIINLCMWVIFKNCTLCVQTQTSDGNMLAQV